MLDKVEDYVFDQRQATGGRMDLEQGLYHPVDRSARSGLLMQGPCSGFAG
jgi:hypothetical protein